MKLYGKWEKEREEWVRVLEGVVEGEWDVLGEIDLEEVEGELDELQGEVDR